jgi:PEP-CTERM motif
MRIKNEVLASIAGLVLALAALPSVSRAAIVEMIVDTDTDATVGSITFPTLTGDSDAGVLFSLDGFTRANISSISWTLHPSTLAVTALDLFALQGTPGCSLGQNCSEGTLTVSPTIAHQTFITCSSSGGQSLCGTEVFANENIAFVPSSAPVPEPSTWAMMLVGFAGLGYTALRRKAAVCAIST